MYDFIFHNPTKIIFGKDKIDETGTTVRPLGKNILLVYGMGSIKSSGLYDRVVGSLSAEGITVHEHGGVKPNPTLSHTREGIRKARDAGVDTILAVGGGSAMDEAKGIAAGVPAEHDVWDFFISAKRPSSALPIVTVPTIAATGSEMNGNTVITNEETHEKFAIYSQCILPRVSILDPSLTTGVTEKQTAYGMVDIFSHITEPYFNGAEENAPAQDRLAEGLFLSLFDIADALSKDPSAYAPRADMLWASTIALNGILAAGRGKCRWENHQIAHSLGGLYDTPHGAALSVVIPAWMRWKAESDPRKIGQFASRVMGAKTAADGIHQLKEWFSSLGSPVTMGEIGIQRSGIPAILSNLMPTLERAGMGYITEKEAEKILNYCF